VVTNVVKQRLLAGQPALGTVLGLGSPTAAEILARTGFDFVLVDCQHGDWNDATALAAFRNVSLEGVTPMARVRENDFYTIGRILDRGALGVVVPMVNSAAEAQAAAYAMRYPPTGGRSFGGCLAVHYGADYDAWINREVFLAVQIETAQGAKSAEDIMAVEGVDGCWIGPNDLARSLGLDLKTPAGVQAHTEAILHILEACRRTNKIPGIFTSDPDDARRWLEHGFLFVTVGGDGGFLAGGGTSTLRQLGRP
jgi:4-hydroxy-2-oxoheptanedioate aldolase